MAEIVVAGRDEELADEHEENLIRTALGRQATALCPPG